MKVEVQVTFPTSSLSRNTPEMQAVLFEDPNDARFLTVWPVSQVTKINVQGQLKRSPYILSNIFNDV